MVERMSAADYVAGRGKPAKRHKYNAKRTRASDGRLYPSAKQARRADALATAQRAGEIVGYVHEVSMPIGVDEKGNDVRYRADFMVIESADSGRAMVRFEDVKGRDTATSRAKRAALRQLGIDVGIV